MFMLRLTQSSSSALLFLESSHTLEPVKARCHVPQKSSDSAEEKPHMDTGVESWLTYAMKGLGETEIWEVNSQATVIYIYIIDMIYIL